MRAVVQRVERAGVSVDGAVVGSVERGLLVFLGVSGEDAEADADWLARKLPDIRIFEDDDGRMNRSLGDVGGAILVISQFTLYGNLRKGTRPSFNRAAPPDHGNRLYEHFLKSLRAAHEGTVASGRFGAFMTIDAVHDGPVTLILDTRDKGW
ncbi:MAG: D-tyrosyl-tRNA(Tyr) deacylase [Opitutales bacterium]|nr:D-tyrosyl-tRNA(Tyr) deacylase [Opitutales bacterium]